MSYCKKNLTLLAGLAAALAMASCTSSSGRGKDEANASAAPAVTKWTNGTPETLREPSADPIPRVTVQPAGSADSEQSPSPTPSDARRTDLSIRAIGSDGAGRLVVKPATEAKVAPLGAPSCYGLETDLGWSGDYAAVWEPKSGGDAQTVYTFPTDFEIIQRSAAPVEMQLLLIGSSTLFVYTPRYTDCHALETYFFGLEGGTAFPVSVTMKPDRALTRFDRLPHRRIEVKDEELILTGGYGAGQVTIAVHRFRYDPSKRTLMLQTTEQVEPKDMKYDD